MKHGQLDDNFRGDDKHVAIVARRESLVVFSQMHRLHLLLVGGHAVLVERGHPCRLLVDVACKYDCG